MRSEAHAQTPRHGRRAVLVASAACVLGAVTPKAQAWADDGNGGASLIVAADQASHRVLVVDPGRERGAGIRWSWSPWSQRSLADLAPTRTWRNVSEAKVRTVGGQRLLLAGASEGLVAVVTYPGATVRWSTVIPHLNVHSVEILPNGNVAVAASEPGVVRVYAAAHGHRGGAFTSFDLPGAHGVHWDEQRGLLWAVGQNDLVALNVRGTARSPVLAQAQRVPLPDQSGHDLDRVAGDPSRMWVSTGRHVWQYDLEASAFASYPGESVIDMAGVKSVSDDPLTGHVLTVRPESRNPRPWCTSTIALHLPEGALPVPGAQLYKARWLPR